MSEYGRIREELKKHDTQYNKEFMAYLSGAEEFYKLGGFPRYLQYKEAREKQLADETLKNDMLYDIEQQNDSLGENIDTGVIHDCRLNITCKKCANTVMMKAGTIIASVLYRQS